MRFLRKSTRLDILIWRVFSLQFLKIAREIVYYNAVIWQIFWIIKCDLLSFQNGGPEVKKKLEEVRLL